MRTIFKNVTLKKNAELLKSSIHTLEARINTMHRGNVVNSFTLDVLLQCAVGIALPQLKLQGFLMMTGALLTP